jgi:hypothetical protein
MLPLSTVHFTHLLVSVYLVIALEIGEIAALMMLHLMMVRFGMGVGSFQFTIFHQVSSVWRVRFGLLQSMIGPIPLYYFHQSIDPIGSLGLLPGLLHLFFHHFIHSFTHSLMRHRHPLPELPFDLGTIVLSPGIIALLPHTPDMSAYLDRVLEYHSATDFGIISRSTRFDNVLAALLGAGKLTSRYLVPRTICPEQSGVIITTHLDISTTTIRFDYEQE